MAARKSGDTQPCTRADAINRLRQAEALVEVADMVIAGLDDDVATPGVAAALAVLAGIAASDAACCARLRERPRGRDHMDAVPILRMVHPNGEEMARDLARLLRKKDDAHYGVHFVGRGEAEDMVRWAKRITGNAATLVEVTS